MARKSCRLWVAAGVLVASMAPSAPIQAQGAQPGGPLPSKGAPATSKAPAPAAPAASKPATESKAAANPEADATKLYLDGVKAENAGQLEKARELLLKSFELKQGPETAGRLGRIELKTGKYLEAAEHLTFYLQQAQGLSDAERQATEKQIADAKAKLGAVTVRVDIEGAEVLVDGQSIGKSPLAEALVLEPGAWQFEARKDGYTPARQSLAVKPGETLEVALKLVPLPPAETPKPAVGPEQGTETPPADPGPPPPKWRTWAMIGGAGLTAVGLGVGVGLTVAANGKSKEANDRLVAMKDTTPTTYTLCGPKGFPLNKTGCTELKDTLSAQDRMTNGAVAMYVIGGVAALGTAALYLYPRFQRKRATGVLIMPAVGSGQKGVVVSGSF
jgi:hypothetical protein